jgi:hypothetical protein
MRTCVAILPLLVALATTPGSAFAQTAPADSPICTDRPTNGNYACTVPAGMVQIETDVINWAANQANGERVDSIAFTNPVFKYGLTDNSDVQIAWAPYVRVRSRDAARMVGTDDGVGNVTLRYKRRLTDPANALQIAVLPFVKMPTAPDGIGNGKVEGGIAVPINYSVPGGWTLTLGPQFNVIADTDGSGYRTGLTGLVNVAKSLGVVTLLGELWTRQDFTSAGTVDQYSADAAVVWLARPNLQFDIGANFGLNRNTPDVVSYIGVSTRF